MMICKDEFGKTPHGEKAYVFTLTNENGMVAKITNYGGIVLSLMVHDKTGALRDVVLGYDNIEKYYDNNIYLGVILGRVANRIAKGEFTIDGKHYKLAINNGVNHLHGGIVGFGAKLWNAQITDKGLVLTYLSVDGEENYPGNLKVKVTYSLTEDNELVIDYYAVSDKATPVNLSNHSYFNLEGHDSGSILEHKLLINADSYTPADEGSIPTGEIRSVDGTYMDFRKPRVIGESIDENDEQLVFAGGYDHNWVINRKGEGVEKAAELFSDKTGIQMEVYTTSQGIQMYAGNYMDSAIDKLGKGNALYKKRSGVCLETQYFPNSINTPNFKSCLLRAGEEYSHTTRYKFSIKK